MPRLPGGGQGLGRDPYGASPAPRVRPGAAGCPRQLRDACHDGRAGRHRLDRFGGGRRPALPARSPLARALGSRGPGSATSEPPASARLGGGRGGLLAGRRSAPRPGPGDGWRLRGRPLSHGLLAPLFVIGSILAAPLLDEIVARGFLYETLRRSRLGVLGAILVPPVLWAVLTLGSLAGGLALLFFGVLLGVVRWRSGSTYLTIALHALVNLALVLQTGIALDRSGTSELLQAARAERGQHESYEYYQALWNLRDAERLSHGPCPECALEGARLFLAAGEPGEAANAARRAVDLAASPTETAQARELLGQAREAQGDGGNGSR
ncbi:MAG TPA: CPBP family intramembrane glutamic endopeptidase [Thermoanaerobaculia bacterium]